MFHAKSTSSSAPFCMFKQNVCISALKALLVTMSGEAVNSNNNSVIKGNFFYFALDIFFICHIMDMLIKFRGMAQFGRAHDWGS